MRCRAQLRVAAAACLCLSGTLAAKKKELLTEEQLAHAHSLLDRDGDGHATMPEMMALAQQLQLFHATRELTGFFSAMDRDGDGMLSLEEHLLDIKKAVGHLSEEATQEVLEFERTKFKVSDADSDGLLTQADAVALHYPETHDFVLDLEVAEQMRQRDRDGDKKLTYEEFYKISEDDTQHLMAPSTASRKRDFETLDEDKDGLINIEELRFMESGRFYVLEAARAIWKAADSSGEGNLSVLELQANQHNVPPEAIALVYDWIRDHQDL